MGNRNNDVLEAIQNNLEDGVKYNNVYDVELAARLVEKKRINNYFNQETNFQYFNFQSTHTKEFSVCICICIILLF